MYDFIIVGAGPSGSTFARVIDKRYKVLIIEKRNMEDSTDFKHAKCCGGLLAPEAQKELASQKLSLPKHVLVNDQPFTVKTIDFDSGYTRYYQKQYINTNRELFDRWLFSLIGDNVDKKTNAIFKGYEKISGGYKVNVLCNGEKQTFMTKYIVDASGATSGIIRKNFTGKELPRTYKSIQKWYDYSGDKSHYIALFDKYSTDYYGWAIPKDDKIVVGIATQYNDSNDRFEMMIRKLETKGYQFAEATRKEGALIFRPRLRNNIHLFKGNILFIGESAGLISPSSAEGISYALSSGEKLAKSINEDIYLFKDNYKKYMNSYISALRFRNLKSSIMYSGLLRKQIFKSGALSMEVKDEDYRITK